jgi:hypothetical protein
MEDGGKYAAGPDQPPSVEEINNHKDPVEKVDIEDHPKPMESTTKSDLPRR